MVSSQKTNLQAAILCAILVMAIAPMLILAQENALVTEGDSSNENSMPESPPNPNHPTLDQPQKPPVSRAATVR